MTRLALLLALAGACKSQESAKHDDRPAPMSAAEIQRSTDACKAYLDRVCACTAPAAVDACKLARSLPAAIDLGLSVAANPESKANDVVQAYDSVRKTVKECIEQMGKLPSLGCS